MIKVDTDGQGRFKVVEEEVPYRNAVNEVLRDEYVADCERALRKWNRTLAEGRGRRRVVAAEPALQPPPRPLLRATTSTPEGELITTKEEFKARTSRAGCSTTEDNDLPRTRSCTKSKNRAKWPTGSRRRHAGSTVSRSTSSTSDSRSSIAHSETTRGRPSVARPAPFSLELVGKLERELAHRSGPRPARRSIARLGISRQRLVHVRHHVDQARDRGHPELELSLIDLIDRVAPRVMQVEIAVRIRQGNRRAGTPPSRSTLMSTPPRPRITRSAPMSRKCEANFSRIANAAGWRPS